MPTVPRPGSLPPRHVVIDRGAAITRRLRNTPTPSLGDATIETCGTCMQDRQDADTVVIGLWLIGGLFRAQRSNLLHIRYKQPDNVDVCAGQHGSVSQYYDL